VAKADAGARQGFPGRTARFAAETLKQYQPGRKTWLIKLLALVVLPWQPGSAAEPDGAVYCSAAGGAKILAVATTPEGQLRFGVSVWSPEGSNISVFGVANPASGGWRYTEADGHCAIDITPDQHGGFTVRADAAADCHEYGGHGSLIGSLHFTAAQKEGPATAALQDPEAFQHAGRCANGH
jgi:hypothetical protein